MREIQVSSGNIEKWTLSCSRVYMQRDSACTIDVDAPKGRPSPTWPIGEEEAAQGTVFLEKLASRRGWKYSECPDPPHWSWLMPQARATKTTALSPGWLPPCLQA